jgi:hypothetical protein
MYLKAGAYKTTVFPKRKKKDIFERAETRIYHRKCKNLGWSRTLF